MTRRGRHVQRGSKSSSIANGLPHRSLSYTHTHTGDTHRTHRHALTTMRRHQCFGSLGFFRYPNSKNGTLERSHVQGVYQGAARLLLGGNDDKNETQFQVCQCTWQRLSRCYKHMCPCGVRMWGLSFLCFDTREYPFICYFSQTPTTKCPALNDIISTRWLKNISGIERGA
jgi:hypothetical protein